MHVRAGDAGVCLCRDDLTVGWYLPAGWQGLVVGRGAMKVVSGGLLCETLSGTCLMKLQVFIDMGGGLSQRRPCAAPWAALPVTATVTASKEGLERWYIECALRGDADYQRFAGVVRQSASYWLVLFLLEQGTASEKLIGLARRYGVSVSHFRRLCHQALGGAAKPELRDWRTAKALLRMIRGGGSLTDVALEYGYASSSHFSKEVRELLGVAPSRLLDLMEQRG
ncbi:helix-turn-helix domain-containing protein [Pseudomonas gingeri]|uniref:Helix-turn-helix domain-containing protein n=1 Tax=Pseudomonas gingeri TaxID=117681 RepID=A0A7Y7YAL5_9PSED|nr:helix-turn-helix domain-containing protein [Pseudomonas gingeri]NWB27428.1 helix-turn-helix domain-containing protein [Pseudomonas gingeri]NWC31575.1 helix-turn-helix domain-containing protein [Pseudomonas gingeri]NWD04214.1 helix-turn-helix domain-containing protein [Pseudomonas gingeri]NWD48688.1 helix-turn-helix domain-containing protein [Pseudomonas gingeri]NWE34154.1 helix-turn-helix domain-containing protein [Pseudomonas gingeri]